MGSPFIESIRRDIRFRGYSPRVDKAFLYWVRFYINSGKRHPAEMGAAQVKEILSFLANQRHVAANAQKVALSTCYGTTAHNACTPATEGKRLQTGIRATTIACTLLHPNYLPETPAEEQTREMA